MTSNPAGAKAIVNFLLKSNINITSILPHHNYIRASASVSTWESLLQYLSACVVSFPHICKTFDTLPLSSMTKIEPLYRLVIYRLLTRPEFSAKQICFEVFNRLSSRLIIKWPKASFALVGETKLSSECFTSAALRYFLPHPCLEGVDRQTRLDKHPASYAFRNYFSTSIDYNDNMNVSVGAPGP